MHFRKFLLLLLALSPALALAAPITIDLTKTAPKNLDTAELQLEIAEYTTPDGGNMTREELNRRWESMQQEFGGSVEGRSFHFGDGPHDLKCTVFSDGTSGFLYFANLEDFIYDGAEKPGVQFQLKTAAGPLLVPRQPITITSGESGIFPINIDCDGIHLIYAAAKPYCRLKPSTKETVFFFVGLEGITSDFVFDLDVRRAINGLRGAEAVGDEVRGYQAGINSAFSFLKGDGSTVVFIVLTPDQGRHVWRTTFNGQESVILSNATVITDGSSLRLQSDDVNELAFSIFPQIASVKMGNAPVNGKKAWLFSRFVAPGLQQPPELDVTTHLEHAAGPKAATLTGTNEATWDDAAVYQLNIPAAAANRHMILNVHYVGDAARLYAGGKLFDDNLYNGDPFAIALWRIPAAQWPDIRLKILPYSDALRARLPDHIKDVVAAEKAAGTLDEVTVTAADQLELAVTPP